jgi:riboflavin kinase/FMN adenylyltransferase
MVVLEWDRFAGGALWEAFSGPPGKTAVTIGVFDGIHRGHQALIRRIVERPEELIPTVVTFRQSPKEFLQKQGWAGDILSLNRKIAIFEDLGLKAVVLIDFSVNFSRLTGKEFLDRLRRGGNPGYVAIGADFRCGYRMDTDAPRIKAIFGGLGIPTDVLEPVAAEVHPISSSRIRAAIVRGDLAKAARLLGRPVELDLTEMTAALRDGGRFYRPLQGSPGGRRIMPAPGRYPALVYEKNSPGGKRTEIAVESGGLWIPPPFDAERAEFVTG